MSLPLPALDLPRSAQPDGRLAHDFRAGSASLKVEQVSGESTVTSSYATSPLKLLTPRARGRSVWAYTSSFGGGIVAGDQTKLDLSLGEQTRCFFGTQASSRVYRNPHNRPCGHVTRADVGAGSLLVFAPDPVQAFAGSSYSQRQEFHLAPAASLVLVDWFTSGRVARGERWEFKHFQSRNDVFVGDVRVFLDSIRLDEAESPIASQHRTGRYNCFATLHLLGPACRSIATTVSAGVAAQPVARGAALLSSASPVRDGVVLRVAGVEVEAVGRTLHAHLAPLADQLGDDPWARKW